MTAAQKRYLVFALIALAVLVADQASKIWADNWLASPKTLADFPAHPVEMVVPEGAGGKPIQLKELLAAELTWSSDAELDELITRNLLVDGARGPHPPDMELRPGQKLTLRRRIVVVHPEHWTFRFVRNPGAAWGFLRNLGASARRPVFITISLLSVVFILYILRRSEPDQHLLHIALALILGGALGNLVDRVRFGFVIDFIDWFVTVGGKVRTWPTFNIADAGITVGVGLMLIEILRPGGAGARAAEKDRAAAEARAASTGDKATGGSNKARSGSKKSKGGAKKGKASRDKGKASASPTAAGGSPPTQA